MKVIVICTYGGVFARDPSCSARSFDFGGRSKLVHINPHAPLPSLISKLCSFFPAAGLDAARVALKCRLPGDLPEVVFDVPDDYALGAAVSECRRRAKNLPGLVGNTGRLCLFLTTTPPSPESAPADEEPPLIDLSTPTKTYDKKQDEFPPEVVNMIEELKDGLMSAAAGQQPGTIREEDSPPPPPSRWLKSGRWSGNRGFPRRRERLCPGCCATGKGRWWGTACWTPRGSPRACCSSDQKCSQSESE